MQFSANDNDNDDKSAGSCAKSFKGASCYRSCLHSNLNGLYLNGPYSSYADGVNWGAFRGISYEG